MKDYHQYPVFSEEECYEYIEYFKEQPLKDKRVWRVDVRQHVLFNLPPDHELYSRFFDRISDQHKEISNQLGIEYKEDIRLFDVWLSEYRTGDIVKWHYDRQIYAEKAGDPVNPRLYNVSVVLNEEFEGGDLSVRATRPKRVFTIPNPKLGYGSSFPTRHVHQVNKITSGRRFVLITWVYHEHPSYYPKK